MGNSPWDLSQEEALIIKYNGKTSAYFLKKLGKSPNLYRNYVVRKIAEKNYAKSFTKRSDNLN